jgi:hypothetical protein
MKKNDILIIVVVAIVAGVFSFIVANFLFGGQKNYNLDAPTVQPITAEFKTPDTKYFNKDSLDITKDITVEDNSNNKPFSN